MRIPIACGENEATVHGFAALLAAGAADIVQPSMTKVGGMGEMKKIAALAAAANATLVPHSFYFGPGLAATLHVAASTPGVPYVEFPPGRLEAPLVAEPIRCTGGVGARPPPPRARRRSQSGCPCALPLRARGAPALLPDLNHRRIAP